MELDIELSSEPSLQHNKDRLVIRSGERPARPSGLSSLPLFTVLRYSSPDIIIKPDFPANLLNPIVAWFAEQASILISDSLALFAQFMRALKMARARKINYFYDNLELTEDAVRLLNTTLGRIRRSVPETPDALAQEIYSDDSGQLWSR